jgi:hypothetical protein
MTEQLTGTLCAYLLAIPTIALAAHRGLQRWQVVRMLTPPPVPVCERTWWKKVVKIVAFIIVYGAFLWILTLRSWIVEKVVWTALLAFYTGGSAYQVRSELSLCYLSCL